MRKAVFGIFRVAALLYVLALTALYTLQRSVLYVPPSVYLTPVGVNLDAAAEIARPQSSNDIMGWWLPPRDNSAPVVMFFHGNGSAVYSSHEIYKDLHAQGFGVFALAYPGYPGRSGQTTQDSLTQAAQDGYDYIKGQGSLAEKIVFYGTSLGAGVAAQLSLQRQPAMIIMEAPFTSAADMAQLRFPMFPAARLTKDKFKSDDALAKSQIPLLWLHGTQDRVIPIDVGQKLFDGYDGPKTSYVIKGGRHNDLWYRGGRKIIIQKLAELNQEP